jgi:drug/metabolite transporter (DMT)-like permease
MVYALGLGAAILLACGFVIQQHVAAQAPADERLSPKLLLDLAHRPMWLVGIGAMVAGQILGAIALGHGSLTVVEPILATNLLFALPLAAAWRRVRLGVRELAGAVLLIVGLAGFVAAAGPANVTVERVSQIGWVIAGLTVLAISIGFVAIGKRCDAGKEATLMAAGAGTLYGLQDALTQRTVLILRGGLVHLLTSWQPYALLFVAVLGLTLAQSAFETAPLPASLPAITIAEPICGIALGGGLLGESIRVGGIYLASEAACMVLMVSGVLLVARSPVVTGQPRHAIHFRRRSGGEDAAANRYDPTPGHSDPPDTGPHPSDTGARRRS